MTNVPTPESIHIQAPEGQGCPSCGGYVYHADQVNEFSTFRVRDGTKYLINVSITCCISIPCVSYRFGLKVMHGTKAATNARFAIEALTLEWPAMHPMDTYIVQVNILEAIRFIN